MYKPPEMFYARPGICLRYGHVYHIFFWLFKFIIKDFFINNRFFGIWIKSFHHLGMSKIKYTGNKVNIPCLCYIYYLVSFVLILGGHYISLDKGIIPDVIKKLLPYKCECDSLH